MTVGGPGPAPMDASGLPPAEVPPRPHGARGPTAHISAPGEGWQALAPEVRSFRFSGAAAERDSAVRRGWFAGLRGGLDEDAQRARGIDLEVSAVFRRIPGKSNLLVLEGDLSEPLRGSGSGALIAGRLYPRGSTCQKQPYIARSASCSRLW